MHPPDYQFSVISYSGKSASEPVGDRTSGSGLGRNRNDTIRREKHPSARAIPVFWDKRTNEYGHLGENVFDGVHRHR
jgi:hypothetical protein